MLEIENLITISPTPIFAGILNFVKQTKKLINRHLVKIRLFLAHCRTGDIAELESRLLTGTQPRSAKSYQEKCDKNIG